MRTRLVLSMLLAASLSAGCAHRDHHDHDGPYHDGYSSGPGRGHGPPPHAPAHGYRQKYQGRDLQYDSGFGVYVVLGLPGLYWHDGWYHRRLGDRWQRSDRADGPWYDSEWDDIPPGLRGAKGKGKRKDKDKRKGGY